ncbi:hypothetical protein GCM10007973_12690 [Polymorphobacter multimanifer]|nr:hypothetical protein GCM10007973_12690 [Polymorphobacter multimanifer]
MHLMEVGIAAAGKRPQQVERARRLQIAAQHALGIGRARFGRERHVVDIVPAVARQADAVHFLEVARARLGELAGHAAHLHHRQLGGEGEDDRHLQQHAEGIADGVGVEIGEALGAVPALEQESLARLDIGKCCGQITRLAGEHQRRIGFDLGFHRGRGSGIGVAGKLAGFMVAPAFGGPGGVHGAVFAFSGAVAQAGAASSA